ncbi:MAG: hypothetical protein ACK5V0_12935 [Alphaproteobacteria bacterium]
MLEKTNQVGWSKVMVPGILELKMETRAKREVRFTLELSAPTVGTDLEATKMRDRYRGVPNITFKPTGPRLTYNCHGLTFASGRGWVVDDDVRGILKDDDYIQVSRAEVMVGDVILYVSVQGDVEHSGRVVSYQHGELAVPLILSKWGKGEEVIHPANHCEYDYARAEFWRLSR